MIAIAEGVVAMGDRVLIDRLDLRVDPGSCVMIRGANGSGKTTLLRCLAGVKALKSGAKIGVERCAYVPAGWSTGGVSARRWLTCIPRRVSSNGVDRCLERLGFEGSLDADWRELSYGNRRKLALAEAFASGEALVVIDELLAGLDRQGRLGLGALITDHLAAGRAIVVAEQDDVWVGWPVAEYRIIDRQLVQQNPLADAAATRTVTLSGTDDALARYLDSAADFHVRIDQ